MKINNGFIKHIIVKCIQKTQNISQIFQDKKRVKQKLESERERGIREAAQKFLQQGDLKGIKEDLLRIETISQLLYSTQKAHGVLWFVLISAICLLLIGLASTLHISSTRILLDINTRNVTFTLRESWSSKHRIISKTFFIAQLSNISFLNLNSPAIMAQITSVEKPKSIYLTGEKEITLQDVTMNANAKVTLSLTATNRNVEIAVENSQITGKLRVEDGDLTLETEQQKITQKIEKEPERPPVTINFKALKSSNTPINLKFTGIEDWKLWDFQVKTLNFLEEFRPNSGTAEFAILSGSKITLLETDRIEHLQKTDVLKLNDIKSSWLKISGEGDKMKVLFEGTVSGITTGTKNFRKTLTPTYLEYIYHQKKLTIIWGTVVTIWGILFIMRRKVF